MLALIYQHHGSYGSIPIWMEVNGANEYQLIRWPYDQYAFGQHLQGMLNSRPMRCSDICWRNQHLNCCSILLCVYASHDWMVRPNQSFISCFHNSCIIYIYTLYSHKHNISICHDFPWFTHLSPFTFRSLRSPLRLPAHRWRERSWVPWEAASPGARRWRWRSNPSGRSSADHWESHHAFYGKSPCFNR